MASILSPHTGQVIALRLSERLNIFMRELVPPGNLLFLCPEECSFELHCPSDSPSSITRGQSLLVAGGIAVKLSKSFAWTGFILPEVLPFFLLSSAVDDSVHDAASGLASTSLFGLTWKKFLIETGGVKALVRAFLLIGVCTSMTTSLAAVGITIGRVLPWSTCSVKIHSFRVQEIATECMDLVTLYICSKPNSIFNVLYSLTKNSCTYIPEERCH